MTDETPAVQQTPPPVEKKTGHPTDYVILEESVREILRGDPQGAWFAAKEIIAASSAEAAVRKYAAIGMLEPGGVTVEPRRFVAVPARSWRPVTVGVEVQTHLTVT